MAQNNKNKICPDCRTENDVNAIICENEDCQYIFPQTASLISNPPPVRPRLPTLPPLPRSWLIALAALATLVIFSSWLGFSYSTRNWPFQPAIPTPMPAIGQDGIGITRTSDGEFIGISDGRYVIDGYKDRADFAEKEQAAKASMASNFNMNDVRSYLNAAHEKDTSDAEPIIYMQNLEAISRPHITIIVGTLFGEKTPDGYSRDYLQSAAVFQRYYNAEHQGPNDLKLRLLIAASGEDTIINNLKTVQQQILQATHYDHTIVAIFGWISSKATLNMIPFLNQYKIPMISGGASTDDLTGASSYYFRITPPNKEFAQFMASLVEGQGLKNKRLVIFKDDQDTYSQTLAHDFDEQFSDKYQSSIVCRQDFTVGGDSQKLSQLVSDTVQRCKPDIIVFTSIKLADMKTLLEIRGSSVEIVMGTAGYELADVDQDVEKKILGYTNLLFSSPASPDAWTRLGQGQDKPPFFKDPADPGHSEYQNTFDDGPVKHPGKYGFDRPTSFVMLGYDVMQVFLEGCKRVLEKQPSSQLTPETLRSALASITGSQSIQGITGQISFGSDSNPINKEQFILSVVDGKHTIVDQQGCFLKGKC